MDITKIQETIATYSVIINALLSLVTIVISLITIMVTSKNAKKQNKDSEAARKQQQEQFDISLIIQKQQYAEERAHNELVGRLHELPYLVFSKAEGFYKESDTMYCINLCFINKGRGSAYDIIPELTCKADGYNVEIVMIRCEAIQDPIALVNEKLVTYWKIESKSGKLGFQVHVPIKYNDASGRQYTQEYVLIIDNDGKVMVTNYANPKLFKE